MSRRVTNWILVACVGLVFPTLLSAQPPPNVKLNTDVSPYLQNEEQVWINLTDSLNVIADWRDWRLGFRRVGIGISNDGGATWFDQLVDPMVFNRQSDPCLVGDNTGRFFMNMLDYDVNSNNTNSLIVVYTSTNGGLFWNGPVPLQPVGFYFEDKQFTAVDRTGGPYDGNYYCSWTRFPNPDRMIFVRSTDGGLSFDDTVTVGPVIQTACGAFDQGQFSIPIVNSDGSVHVFWQGGDWDSAACSGYRAIRRARSTDGGVTFTRDSVAFRSTLGYELVDGNIDVYGMPNGDADISGGPYDGSIYIARTEYAAELTGETNVVVHKSTDQGITWLDTVTINDDLPGQNIDQFHPWLIVNEDGTIVTVFYDQRNDPITHYLFDCYFSASYDGAETFTTNYRLSSVSSSPSSLAALKSVQVARNAYDLEPGIVDPTVNLNPMAGAIAEYIGVHAKHDYVVAVWTDTRMGTQDVFSTRFTIPFLKPRLYLPDNGSETPSLTPPFRWSTCWHETEDSYRLEVSTDPTFSAIDASFAGLTDNNFAPGAPLPSGTLYWRVKAFRTAGDSTQYSDVYSFTTGCQAGAAPNQVTPVAGDTVAATSALLVWDVVGDANNYQFQLSVDPDFLTTEADTVLPVTFYDATDLSNNTIYYWRVNSTNACGTGDWSETEFQVLCQAGATPALLAPAAADTLDVSHADLEWDIVPDAQDYRLQLSSLADFSVNLVDTTLMLPAYAATGLEDSTDYYWRVNSTNACVTGAWSESYFTVIYCPILLTGDVNVDAILTSSDIIYLVNYVFKSGPAPLPVPQSGDVDCSGLVNSADIIFMVNYVFKSGPTPCNACSTL